MGRDHRFLAFQFGLSPSARLCCRDGGRRHGHPQPQVDRQREAESRVGRGRGRPRRRGEREGNRPGQHITGHRQKCGQGGAGRPDPVLRHARDGVRRGQAVPRRRHAAVPGGCETNLHERLRTGVCRHADRAQLFIHNRREGDRPVRRGRQAVQRSMDHRRPDLHVVLRRRARHEYVRLVALPVLAVRVRTAAATPIYYFYSHLSSSRRL